MPRVQAPDGKIIDFPEGTPAEEMEKAMGDYHDARPFAERHPWLDTALDVGKSTLNVGKGIVGATVGLPGDIADLINTGIDVGEEYLPQKWKDKLGIPDEPTHSDIGTTEQIVRATGLPTYEPHTTAGKYMSTIAEMAPAFAVPEELLLNEVRVAGKTAAGAARASRPAKRGVEALKEGAGGRAAAAVAAGAGAESAGELTGDDPLARFVGGGLGGMTAGLNTVRRATNANRAALASSEAAAKNSYDFLANSQHPIAPMEMQMLGDTIDINLHQNNYRRGTAPQTYSIIDSDLRAPSANVAGKPSATAYPSGALTMQYPGQVPRRVGDLVSTHEALGMIKPGVNTSRTDFSAAQQARENIRSFLERLPDKQIGKQHKNAIRNWAQHAKEQDVREAVDQAERRAGRTGRGLNYQNTIRQEIGKVLQRRRQRGGLSKEEEDLMRRIESGNKLENLTRVLSSFAPWDLHRAFVNMAVGYGLGPVASFGLAGAGAIAHELGKVLSKRDIEELVEAIRKQAPANRQQAGRNATALARAQNAQRAATARGAAVGAAGGHPYGDPASNLSGVTGDLAAFATRFNPISSAQAGEPPPDDLAAHGKINPGEALDPMPGSAGLAGRTTRIGEGLQAGKSFAQIAREMGTTRNAVAGLASRAGLKASRTAKHTDEGLAALRESGKATGGLASHPTGWTRGPRPIPQVRVPALPLSVREQIMREQRYGTGRPTPSLPQFNLPPVPEEESMLTPEEVLENPQAA